MYSIYDIKKDKYVCTMHICTYKVCILALYAIISYVKFLKNKKKVKNTRHHRKDI